MIHVSHPLQRISATNDRPSLGCVGKSRRMRHRRGQQQRTGAGHHPQEENDFPIRRECEIPNGKRPEQDQRNPDGGEFLNAALESRRDLAEGVDGVDEA